MAVHDEILATAVRICGERGVWRFAADDVVRALPHLNAGTVRTHITSRCCVNAPVNHPHKWDYFKRIGRGAYEVMAKYRQREVTSHSVAREKAPAYGRATRPVAAPSQIIHAFISNLDGWYSAQCVEVAVVTQGRTLDETVANLREAVALHLEGEDLATMGVSGTPILSIALEEPLRRGAEAPQA